MKTKTLLLLMGLYFVAVQAGENKLFETKITATPVIVSGAENETMIFAGTKNFNVVDLSNGKMLLDKTYKETGITVSKANDACFTSKQLIVCDNKTVSCIDITSGTKLWENSSFVGLSANDNGSLLICDTYVLVSDKKGSSLTCLKIADGTTVWNNKVPAKNIYFISGSQYIGVFTPKDKKVNQVYVIDIETGKISNATDIEGDPVAELLDKENGNLYLHNLVSEKVSYVTAFNLKQGNYLWKTKAANKSSHTPMTMNTSVITYYASMEAFDNKILLTTEGIEVFDAATGESLYNIPFVPYYKWGAGHYINGIFKPVITPNGILIADRTSGDMYIKMYDKNTGQQLWSTDKLKKKDCAPTAFVTGESAVIQFGGLNYFEVINNGDIGKLLDPFEVVSFDLKTGKTNWTVESKQDFYYIDKSNENIMIAGKNKLQILNPQNGTEIKSDKNPFGEDYFMTTFTLNSTHKIQKDVMFDFSSRTLLRFESNKLSKYSF
jgi:outer membrane protein assembly factor BamB